jgi:hypothetical protein
VPRSLPLIFWSVRQSGRWFRRRPLACCNNN